MYILTCINNRQTKLMGFTLFGIFGVSRYLGASVFTAVDRRRCVNRWGNGWLILDVPWRLRNISNTSHILLVGGLEHEFYFPNSWGAMIQSDFHIFQRGWNHQPVKYIKYILNIWNISDLPSTTNVLFGRYNLRKVDSWNLEHTAGPHWTYRKHALRVSCKDGKHPKRASFLYMHVIFVFFMVSNIFFTNKCTPIAYNL